MSYQSIQNLQILRKLKHENIIEMLDSFESPQEFCVVTEFAQVFQQLLCLRHFFHAYVPRMISLWMFGSVQ